MQIIELTPSAQQHAKELLGAEKESREGLRVAVIGGGCSGLQYQLEWGNEKDGDLVHECENGLKVMVDEKSSLYLVGSQIEYHDDLSRSGFEVKNPNASNTCGCGESFS